MTIVEMLRRLIELADGVEPPRWREPGYLLEWRRELDEDEDTDWVPDADGMVECRWTPPASLRETLDALGTALADAGLDADQLTVEVYSEVVAPILRRFDEPVDGFGHAHVLVDVAAETDDGEVGWSILAGRAVVALAPLERELLRAAASGDADAVAAALAAGADGAVRDPRGRTPIDAAIAARPYPAATLALLREAGGRSALLSGLSVRELLRALPLRNRDAQLHHVNKVRYLLEIEGPQSDSLLWLLGATGYYEREVGGEVLAELTEVLLRGGAVNAMTDDMTALDHAAKWAENSDTPQYSLVLDRLRAEGFASVRDLLRHGPADAAATRSWLDRIATLLSEHGVPRDVLHLPPRAAWRVPEPILAELTALLLRHGAPDASVMGLTPLDHAQAMVDDGRSEYRVVVDLLRARGFTRGLHHELADFPDADPAARRVRLDRMRELLAADGAHPEALHWWLFEHRWPAERVAEAELVELTRLLLAHGARSTFKGSPEPLRHARHLTEIDGYPHYRGAVALLESVS